MAPRATRAGALRPAARWVLLAVGAIAALECAAAFSAPRGRARAAPCPDIQAGRPAAPPAAGAGAQEGARPRLPEGVAQAVLCLLAAAVVTASSFPSRAEKLDAPDADFEASIASEMQAQGFSQARPAEPAGAAPAKTLEMKPDVPPSLTQEELIRRHESPFTTVKGEDWYQNGRQVFVAKCAGCHPAGSNTIVRSKTLYWADMLKYGFAYKNPADGTYEPEEERIKSILRYGQGYMPGFAKDCAEKGDVLKCGVVAPLTEVSLQDVQDFVINRANANWSGRG